MSFGVVIHQGLRARAPRLSPERFHQNRALHASRPAESRGCQYLTPMGHQMLVLALLTPRANRARAGRGLALTPNHQELLLRPSTALPKPSSMLPNREPGSQGDGQVVISKPPKSPGDGSNSSQPKTTPFLLQQWFCRLKVTSTTKLIVSMTNFNVKI
jgi:hypothetical protein